MRNRNWKKKYKKLLKFAAKQDRLIKLLGDKVINLQKELKK